MINNLVDFTPAQKIFIKSFNGDPKHWEGTEPKQTQLRARIRNHYRKEQNNQCAYCYRVRQDFHGYCWDIDHIIPKSTHPKHTYEVKNFAVTCKECNIAKDNFNVLSAEVDASDVYPYKKEDYIIIHPHLDDYTVHMKVSYDENHRVFHTPLDDKGRETFTLCGLQRFTEEITGTGEFIKSQNKTIGFTDDKFLDYYQGYQTVMSAYDSSPALKFFLLTKALSELTGFSHEAIASQLKLAEGSSEIDLSFGQFTASLLSPPPDETK